MDLFYLKIELIFFEICLNRKRGMNENNKDAIIARLKRKIKNLLEENKQIKEQVKISYGYICKKI